MDGWMDYIFTLHIRIDKRNDDDENEDGKSTYYTT